jgi:hypothetical protein
VLKFSRLMPHERYKPSPYTCLLKCCPEAMNPKFHGFSFERFFEGRYTNILMEN